MRTLEAGDPVMEAIAITGDKVSFVGEQDEALAAFPDAEIVDIDGGVVIPGITDSHTHFKRASGVLSLHIDFDAVEPRNIGDVTDAIADRVAIDPPGKWVQGDSLEPTRLAEKRFPTRQELDAVSTANPVVLRSVGRHVVAANSLALEAAGIDAATPDPVGGRIEHDEAGEPTGVLHEEAKLRLDANRADTVVPPDSTKDRFAALSRSVELLNRHGIVAIHEMPRDPDQISDWLLLHEQERPRVRVRFYVRGLAAQTSVYDLLRTGLRSGFGNEFLKLGGVKFSIDGSGTFGNAMVYEPYPGQPDNVGLQRVETDEFIEAVRLSHESGLQIAVHAFGQRAVDMALDAFQAIAVPRSDLAARRHRIEHAYLPPRPGQLERIHDLGLVLSTQPSFIEAVGDAWRRVFADDELNGVMPVATAMELGIPIQFNSDFPCSKLNPFVGIKAAVVRETSTGHVLDQSQAIDVEAALRFMTHAPAHTAFEESWRGHLRPGYAADLVVVDRDPLLTPPDELDQIDVVRTVVGGESVFVA
ncbi:MAG: amidohydrolase [Acidimicrobiia bacterium]|nr:amidohydrolase [Acidimicrobiia bacterium]